MGKSAAAPAGGITVGGATTTGAGGIRTVGGDTRTGAGGTNTGVGGTNTGVGGTNTGVGGEITGVGVKLWGIGNNTFGETTRFPGRKKLRRGAVRGLAPAGDGITGEFARGVKSFGLPA